MEVSLQLISVIRIEITDALLITDLHFSLSVSRAIDISIVGIKLAQNISFQ
jgi:hypothetical protein